MKRFKGLGIAISTALVLTVALGSPASAFSLIKLTGNHGDFGTKPASADSQNLPGAKCGYSAPVAGVAHLAWIKVYGWKAIAFDRTGATDSQPITFKVTVQRSKNGGATWKNLGSASQTRTTTDAKAASFASLTVNTSGKLGETYRAMVTLTWLHNGSAEGTAKALMEFYSVKWTVGSPSFVYQDACDGAAD